MAESSVEDMRLMEVVGRGDGSAGNSVSAGGGGGGGGGGVFCRP